MRQLGTSGLQFLLALVLALALWTFVSFTENPPQQRSFTVPVELSGRPDDLTVVDPSTGRPLVDITATVRVRGPQQEIQELNEDQIEAFADVSGLAAGLHTVPVRVNPPRGLQLVSVQPATLTVRLEQTATRTLPVEEDVEGQLPFSYSLNGIELATEQAVVSGPLPLVERVERVVAPVDLQGRTSSTTESIELEALDGDGAPVPGVTLSPASTDVAIRIEARIDVQRVAVLPQFEGDPAQGYIVERYDWEPKFIEVFAPVVETGALRTEPITLTDRTESFTETVALVDADELMTRLPAPTVKVSVTIIPFEVTSSVPVFVSVTPTGLGPNLRASAQPSSLPITVSGTFQQLSELTNTTVQATVDLNDLGPGTYTLPVEIELPEGLAIVEPAEPTVTVTIEQNAPRSTPTAPARGG